MCSRSCLFENSLSDGLTFFESVSLEGEFTAVNCNKTVPGLEAISFQIKETFTPEPFFTFIAQR